MSVDFSREYAKTIDPVLRAAVPEDLKSSIGAYSLRGGTRSYALTYTVNPAHLEEIRGLWKEAFNNDPALKVVQDGEERKLFVVPQRDPKAQPKYRTFGKLKDKITSARKDAALPGSLIMNWDPDWNLVEEESGDVVLWIGEGNRVRTNDELVRKYLGLEPAALRRAAGNAF